MKSGTTIALSPPPVPPQYFIAKDRPIRDIEGKKEYKARLVVEGYNIFKINFIDVFSLIVNHSSIRASLCIITMHNFELKQLDVKTTFSHGELEEDIYMQQLENKEYIRKVKVQLSKEFEMKDFHLLYLLQSNDDVDYMSRVPYSINRYMANPGKEHWKVVQWIFKYLCGTTMVLKTRLDQLSIFLLLVVCAISWKATLHTTIALSIIETKYMAISKASCLDWLVFIVKLLFGVYGRSEEFFLKIVVFFFIPYIGIHVKMEIVRAW
ncbi:hypothetical protein AAG906_004532 [Vitis piasezkii]